MQHPRAANTGHAGRTGPGRGSGAEQGQLEQTGSGQELSRGGSQSMESLQATVCPILSYCDFPSASYSEESACNAEDLGSIPGSGRSPGGGLGNPLQYSCLENSMDRGAWQATVHGVAKSQTQLSDKACTNCDNR